MSRVTRRLRRQRRQARRAARQQKRQGLQPQQPISPTPGQEETAGQPRHASAAGPSAARGPRALTLIAGLSIAAVGAGSAVASTVGSDSPSAGSAPVHTVELEQDHQPAQCPPAPEDADADEIQLGEEDDAASAVIQHVEDGSAASLASAHCTVPQRSQVFLGPETGTGTDSVLTLTNPYDRPATVEVTTVGAEGDRGPLGSTTVLVPAGEDREVSMAGLAGGEEAFAVEVTASGAPVSSSLWSSRSSGGTSLGGEQLTGIPDPQPSHTIAGVPMAETGADVDPAELWLYVPESDVPGEATVELQVYGPDGQVILDTPGVFSQPQGSTAVVELEGAEEPGIYGLRVTTSVQSGGTQEEIPSYAAVRTAGDGEEITAETEQDPIVDWDPITGEQIEIEQDPQEESVAPLPDFSWAAHSASLSPGDRIPADTDAAVLHLFNTGDGEGTITLSDGEEIDVAPHSTAQAELDADQPHIEIEQSTGQIHGAVILRDAEGRFTVLGPPSPESDQTSVPVTLRR